MNWKEKLKTWAPRLGYPVFYLFCFVVFATVTFPFEKLKDKIVASFNAQQKPGPGQQELHIDEMSSSWVTGVKMNGVKLVSLPSDPTAPPVELNIDTAKARISVLPLLIGHKNASNEKDTFL